MTSSTGDVLDHARRLLQKELGEREEANIVQLILAMRERWGGKRPLHSPE